MSDKFEIGIADRKDMQWLAKFYEIWPQTVAAGVRQATNLFRDKTIARSPVGIRKDDWHEPGSFKGGWTPVKREGTGYSFSNSEPHTWALERGSIPGQLPWPGTTATSKGRKKYDSGRKKSGRTIRARSAEGKLRIFSTQAPGGVALWLKNDKATMDELWQIIYDRCQKACDRTFENSDV